MAPDPKHEFRPDIEGLRAVAIGAVLLCHAGLAFAAGGFVGVDVFFVISGFLITRLLLGEVSRTGSVSLRALLRPPGEAAAAALGAAAGGRRRPLAADLLAGPRRRNRRRHRQLRHLHRQLALRRPVGRLLRPGRRTEPGPAPLVAGDRGAVLPRLARPAPRPDLVRAPSRPLRPPGPRRRPRGDPRRLLRAQPPLRRQRARRRLLLHLRPRLGAGAGSGAGGARRRSRSAACRRWRSAGWGPPRSSSRPSPSAPTRPSPGPRRWCRRSAPPP